MTDFVKIATLAFLRDQRNALEPWWSCGDVLYDPVKGRGLIRLYAMRIGPMRASRSDKTREMYPIVKATGDHDDPFLQGTLTVGIPFRDGAEKRQKCGRITTSQSPDGKVTSYDVMLECIPCRTEKDRSGLYLKLEID